MTNQNKLIVGGVVVVLLGYYFYNENKVKNEILKLKKNKFNTSTYTPAVLGELAETPKKFADRI